MTVSATTTGSIAVVATTDSEHTYALLADACDLARRDGRLTCVLTTNESDLHTAALARHGADEIRVGRVNSTGLSQKLTAIEACWRQIRPALTFVSAGGDDRILAARLAYRCDVELITECLVVKSQGDEWGIAALDSDGNRTRQFRINKQHPTIVTMRPGVPQARAPGPQRQVVVHSIDVPNVAESVRSIDCYPADSATADIVHLPRLIAGGRGIGGRAGFDFLRTVARRLDAGVAASRVAVDLGWIERDRQVGQTGKTVSPELYIACGISGASHHRDGMTSSRHVVAINTDPSAPIFQYAHLGLVSDWQETLAQLLRLFGSAPKE